MSNDDTPPQRPESSSDVAGTEPAPPSEQGEQLTPAPAPAPTEPPAPQRRTGVLVAGVAAAVILSAGVGAAFALAVSDGGDDDVTGFTTSGQDDADDSDDVDGPGDGGPTAADGETDLDGMLAAVNQALSVAEGQVVAIEERSPGTWRVDVQGSGRGSEVVVDGSGARVTEEDGDDGDDDGDDLPLTTESVTALVAAATADTAGRVVQIESDDDGYSVEVRTASGSTVEIDLDQGFQIVGSDDDDRDDD